MDKTRAMQVMNIDDLQNRYVRHIIQSNFNIRDLVLVRKAQKKGHKLAYRWVAQRILKDSINEVVFIVKDVVNHTEEQGHASRMVV